jgi:Tfp pilus assembly protein PilV
MSAPTDQSGQSLVEVMIAIALFAVLGVSILGVTISAAQSSKEAAEMVSAAALQQEGMTAVRSIRNRSFAELTNGAHGTTTGSGYYALSGSSDSLLGGKYTRTITVADVYRSGGLTGDIAGSGTLDPEAKKITLTTVWTTLTGKVQTITSDFYAFNLSAINWLQSTLAEFNAGYFNSTDAVSGSGGEVKLRAMDTDWNPIKAEQMVDVNGTGDMREVYFDEANDLLYTLQNSTTTYELSRYSVSGVSEAVPVFIDGFDTAAIVDDFVISGNYAYLATSTDASEVVVVRLSDMTQVNTINIAGNGDATGIDVTGTTLVVSRLSTGDAELYVYDITTPEGTISELGSTDVSGDVNDVVVSSTYAFLASSDNSNEVRAVSLSTYASVGTLNMTGTGDALTLERVGTNLYVGRADGAADFDFAKVNITTPSAMTLTNSVDTASQVNNIAIDVNESFAALATSSTSQSCTMITLSSFTETSSVASSGSVAANAVDIFGAHVYLGSTSDTAELNVYRTTEGGWPDPTSIGTANPAGNGDGTAIYVSGTTVYLGKPAQAGGDPELFIYDVTTPSTPSLLGTFETSADIDDIVVSGSYAYLASSDNSRELDIINISNPAAPVRTGSLNLTGTEDANTVAISGSTIYLGRATAATNEFNVIDVSTPATPTLTGSLNSADAINDLVVSGSYVYAATSDDAAELMVIDVTTPSTPSLTGSLNLTGTANGLTIDLTDSLVAIGRATSTDNEINVIDVYAPASPTLSGSADAASSVNGIRFENSSYLFVATDLASNHWQYWDVSDTSNIWQTSSLSTTSSLNELVYDGTYTYVASTDNSLELQIIGKTTAATGFPREGNFTSQIFDSGSAATAWSTLSWTSSGTGSLSFRLRTASSSAGLASAKWVGSDGTTATTYSTSGSSITVDPGASGTRYFQWKVYETGNGTSSPVLEDVSVSYTQ